jgi:hypothetical protein
VLNVVARSSSSPSTWLRWSTGSATSSPLDPRVRSSQSIWELLGPAAVERIFDRLAGDLESSRWDEEHGARRERASYEGSLRLVISEPARGA